MLGAGGKRIRMEEYKWVVMQNVAVVAAFAAVAIAFDKWWIILFALLAVASYKGDEHE